MTETITPRIERIKKVYTPDAKLYVSHGKEEIAFASPAFGPNTYQSVGKAILGNGFKVPTGDYTASLLHPAYCNPQFSNEPEFKFVRGLMRSNWLWVFNQNLWTDKGVYVIQDLEAKGKSEPFDLKKLKTLERLVNAKGVTEANGVRFSKNGQVRFAPLSTYQLGDHTAQSLSEDGFVIAGYDVEGAKKLAEIASKLKNNPITYGVNAFEGNQPELEVSALIELANGLRVGGDDWSGDDRSHALGVF